jgi:Galactose oxidase, central domain
MKYVRSQETATLMPEGNVLVTGGAESTDKSGYSEPALNSTEMYDPATNSWWALAPMTTARELHSATLLPDGDVLVTGGGDCGGGEGGCLGTVALETAVAQAAPNCMTRPQTPGRSLPRSSAVTNTPPRSCRTVTCSSREGISTLSIHPS